MDRLQKMGTGVIETCPVQLSMAVNFVLEDEHVCSVAIEWLKSLEPRFVAAVIPVVRMKCAHPRNYNDAVLWSTVRKDVVLPGASRPTSNSHH